MGGCPSNCPGASPCPFPGPGASPCPCIRAIGNAVADIIAGFIGRTDAFIVVGGGGGGDDGVVLQLLLLCRKRGKIRG